MDISLLSLQKQPNSAPNLFQTGVEYGKYVLVLLVLHMMIMIMIIIMINLCRVYSGEEAAALPRGVHMLRRGLISQEFI